MRKPYWRTTMTKTEIDERLARIRPLAEAVCARLEAEIHKLGLPAKESRPRPLLGLAHFYAEKDPYSGEESLIGTWSDHRGYRIGGLKFHGNGSFFAEFDVAEPHPADPRWFVESVTAWGQGGTIKSEPQLLAALE